MYINKIFSVLDKYVTNYNYDEDTCILTIEKLNLEKFEHSDIKFLEQVKHINGELIISNTSYDDLSFFNILLSVDELNIENNLNMADISGFNSLIKINTLHIKRNKNLSNISGFRDLTKDQNIIEWIKITDNYQLDNISFLSGLSEVKRSLYLHNNKLKTLDGLECLKSVGNSLSLSFNELTSLENLSSLNEVNGVINLKNNNLTTLSGFENLKYVNNIVWNGENRSLVLENNKINDISALKNLKDKSGTLVLSLEYSEIIKKPAKNSIFSSNEIIEIDPKYHKVVNNKKAKKRIAGIISTRNMKRFLNESKKIYDDSIKIIPNEIVYICNKDSNEIIIDYNGFLLNNLSLLFVYSIDSYNDKESVLYLSELLEFMGCSVCACRPKILGKLHRTIYEGPNGYESRQYIVSSYKAAERLFKDFNSKQFPLISKPINGAQGWGIEKLDDLDSLMVFIKTYYANGTKPLIIEHYFNLIKEWRVFVVDGVVITSYEKVRTTDTFKFNISQGAIPKKTTEEDQKRIVEYVKKRLVAPYDKGYYGVDVALKDNGELFLIEYNMQAGIAYAKDIAGVDVVYEMFKILFTRDDKTLKGTK